MQCLVEPFIFALGGRFTGFPGDRFDAKGLQIIDQGTGFSAPGRVERYPVIGEEPLRDSVAFQRGFYHPDRRFAGFPGGDQRRQCESGMVIDKLEDRDSLTAGEDPFGGLDLPAPVRFRVNETLIRAAGFFRGSGMITPARVKIRSSVARDGGSIPCWRSFAATLRGP